MSKAQEVFQTQNMALAVTLFTAGVPIPVNEQGRPIPCSNMYDRDILRNLGYKGWKLEDAARDAIDKGKSGTVVYNFVICPKLETIIKSWDQQAEAIRKADEAAGEAGMNNTGNVTCLCECGKSIEVSDSVIARICCQFAKNRKVFASVWKKVKALIVVHGPQTPGVDANGKQTVTGSFKARSIDAGNEMKRRVGI